MKWNTNNNSVPLGQGAQKIYFFKKDNPARLEQLRAMLHINKRVFREMGVPPHNIIELINQRGPIIAVSSFKYPESFGG